ncbi:hypothetical protein MTO96_013889 [Rhipicephalus appendiculatus]
MAHVRRWPPVGAEATARLPRGCHPGGPRSLPGRRCAHAAPAGDGKERTPGERARCELSTASHGGVNGCGGLIGRDPLCYVWLWLAYNQSTSSR